MAEQRTSVTHHAWRFGAKRMLCVAPAVAVLLAAAVADLPGILWTIDGLLGRGAPLDFAQDYIGARALISGGELYPLLSEAIPAIGLDWRPPHYSTHPPSAFLLAAPVAWLSYPLALALWLWAMLACEYAALRLFGWPRRTALLTLPLLLLWPSSLWSLGQLTPVWLLGLAAAWRLRARPLVSGAAVAVAGLPKLLGGIALGSFPRSRQWRALVGFALVWLCVLSLLLAIRPDALATYLATILVESPRQVARVDNGALFAVCWQRLGIPGVALAGTICLALVWRALTAATDERRWACWTWLSVALLPIAWTYSLLPLLPWSVRAARSSQPVERMLAIAGLLAPLLTAMPGGGRPAVGVVLCMILLGAAFMLGRDGEPARCDLAPERRATG